MKKLASWNVNGIRACVKKGYLDWLDKESPDLVALQETKAKLEQFPSELTNFNSYKTHAHSAERPGYSGVAIQTKKDPKKVDIKLGKKIFDIEGRTLIFEYEDFIFFNNYYPNGQRDHARVDFKLDFSETVLKKALKLKKQTGKPIILTGDFNTAHHPIDLANPKTNKKTTGFLPNEREWLTRLEKKGFIDIFRKLHPDEEGHYSWWTYRGDCRARNIGWRIDYFFITEDLIPKVKDCYYRPEVMGSDHCPLILELH